MRVLICGVSREAEREVKGTVELRGEVAVPDERARRYLEQIVVVEPGNPGRRLTVDDGIEYLLALPYSLAGIYTWAELEGRNLHGVAYADLLREVRDSKSTP
jgi:hypothetical protein